MTQRKRGYIQAWKELKDLPHDLWILFISTLINRLGTMAFPFLALYLNESLKYSPSQSGLILMIYGASALVAGPISGYLSDRLGPLLIMIVSLFSSSIVLMLYPFSKSFLAVSLMTILFSFSNETFRPANLSAISDFVPADQRKAAFALNRLATNLGMSVGPALGSFLAQISFPALFFADGATTLISAIFLLISFSHFKPIQIKKPKKLHLPTSDKFWTVLSDSRLFYFLVSILPVIIVFFQYEAAVPIFLVKDLHLPISSFGLLFSINTVTIILLEVPLNHITSHWSFRKTLAVGSSFFAIGFGSLAFAKDIWSVIVTVIIWTFGEMILFPGMSAYVTEIAPPNRRGEYMGLYTMSFSLSCMIGPWLGTQILQFRGGQTLWIFTFWFGLISTFLLSRIDHSHEFQELNEAS